MRCLMILIAVISFAVPCDAQESPERFQVIVISPGTPNKQPDVIILDTREGHLWRYWISPAIGNVPGSEGIKYISKLRPGARPGEVIHSETFR
jgi:hypothetical protein